jgi:hypothetical protein
VGRGSWNAVSAWRKRLEVEMQNPSDGADDRLGGDCVFTRPPFAVSFRQAFVPGKSGQAADTGEVDMI